MLNSRVMCQSGVCNTDNFLSELRRIFGRHSAFKIMEKNRNQRWLDGSFRYDRPRTGELSMAALLVDISLPCQTPNEQCKSGHKYLYRDIAEECQKLRQK